MPSEGQALMAARSLANEAARAAANDAEAEAAAGLAAALEDARVQAEGRAEAHVKRSWQRGQWIFQIAAPTLPDGKVKMVCMLGSAAFGTIERTSRAMKVLLEMWHFGASAMDLARCKQAGCLFGVVCGKKIRESE